MKTSTYSAANKLTIPMLTKSIAKLTTLTTLTTILLSSTLTPATAQDPHPGEALFKTKCTMCHGPNGEGIATFPPLAESEWVNGPAENLVRIQLRGLMGPITVKGKEYNSMMPANAAMTDQEIAHVLTYVRSSMGNKAPAITPDLVKKIRAEEKGNITPLNQKDLIPPKPAEEKPAEPTKPEPAEPTKPEPAKPEPAKPEPTNPEPAEPEKPEKPETKIEPTASATAEITHPGQAIFKQTCTVCHGQNGEGMASTFPPLAESEWVNGPAENLIKIQLHGLSGPIEVKGKLYNNAMPANATMSDQDIAHVLTYIRSSMGNNAPPITPDMVKAHRSDANATPLTAKDLKDPTAITTTITQATQLQNFKPATSNGSPSIILLALGIIGTCTLPALAGLLKN